MKPINLLHLGIASDHAGYQLKEALKAYLEEKQVNVVEQPKRKAGRPKKVETLATNPAEITDIDEFLKQIDNEIAKENAKLEASKKEE